MLLHHSIQAACNERFDSSGDLGAPHNPPLPDPWHDVLFCGYHADRPPPLTTLRRGTSTALMGREVAL
jgi:hypothetical protein